MTIRRATGNDIPAIVAMGQEFIQSTSYREQIPDDAEHLAAVVSLLLQNGAVFVAEDGGYTSGMIAGTVYQHFMTGRQVLGEAWWWVAEKDRGGDLADRLLDALEAWGRSEGATRAELGSRNAVLDRFYRRRGYAPFERVHAKEL